MHAQGAHRNGDRTGDRVNSLDAASAGAASLESILEARESRWAKRLADSRGLGPAGALLTFTLRLPAALRAGGKFDRLVRAAMRALRDAAGTAGAAILREEYRDSADGPEGYIALAAPARDAKELALGIEDGRPWGALVDIDVMGPDGLGESRADIGLPPRPCLVCGGEAMVCSAGCRHRPDEVAEAAAAILAGSGELEV